MAGCQVELSREDHGHSGREEPAKEICYDKSDSQPYFYSSINLIWVGVGVSGKAQVGGRNGDVGAFVQAGNERVTFPVLLRFNTL